MRGLAFFVILAAPAHSLRSSPAGYWIQELRSEDATTPSPFSITRVEQFDGGLRLFLGCDRPEEMLALLQGGGLQAQLSDHQAGTVGMVLLWIGMAVWCGRDDEPVYLAYGARLPECAGKPPARVEYFIQCFVTLGPGRDLAIGVDSDFLWLIEER